VSGERIAQYDFVEGDRAVDISGPATRRSSQRRPFRLGAREDSSGFDAHGAKCCWLETLALNELPSPSRRRRGPCDGDRRIARLLGHVLVQSDEEIFPSDRHPFYPCPEIGLGAMRVNEGPRNASRTLSSISGALTRAIDPASCLRP
jgi:hypothetical protein